jgi:hypothetical protein
MKVVQKVEPGRAWPKPKRRESDMQLLVQLPPLTLKAKAEYFSSPLQFAYCCQLTPTKRSPINKENDRQKKWRNTDLAHRFMRGVGRSKRDMGDMDL